MKQLLNIVSNNRAGEAQGIYAICTAHPLVLDAALHQGKIDGTPILIEATANQVNQFGGYTGMQPGDFIPFVKRIADEVGFPKDQLIFGGDHLGPVCWCNESSQTAMAKSRELIEAYVTAGFNKIHLDTSMPCADDADVLTDDIVAARAAELCDVAEHTARKVFGHSELVYVVGTEVPAPGGAKDAIQGLQVTPAKAVKKTIATHRQAFVGKGLNAAWSRVIGLVVQPGVEFDHMSTHDYAPTAAKQLSDIITEIPNLVYEAHSTDYQPEDSYPALVKDHFAILKVGPQLTYALREALFALSHIEDQLFSAEQRTNLRQLCEKVMLGQPEHWEKYYSNDQQTGKIYRRFSYSDRIRYYWTNPVIDAAVNKLIDNLSSVNLPLPLLGQYLPSQYAAVRKGTLKADPLSLIRHHVMQITTTYAKACKRH